MSITSYENKDISNYVEESSNNLLSSYDTATAPSTINWDDLDKRRFYIIGPSLFLGVRAFVYPSTLVKTRLQLQPKDPTLRLYKNTLDAFVKVKRKEGVRGFYKGFGVNSLGLVTGNVFVTCYEITKSAYLKYSPTLLNRSNEMEISKDRMYTSISDQTETSATTTTESTFRPERYANFVAGAIASVISQTIVVPLDIISQHLMIDSSQHILNKVKPNQTRPTSAIQVCRTIFAREGIRGFYRGYLLSIATYAPSSALWWGSYGITYPLYYSKFSDNFDPSWKQVLSQATAGATSGTLAAIITNPMDVLKTRSQIYTQHGPMETFRFLIKTSGFSGLWNGLTARVLAMAPSGMLAVSTYELVKRLSQKDRTIE